MKHFTRGRSRSTVLWSILTLLLLNGALAIYMATRIGLRDPMFDLPAEHFKQRLSAAPVDSPPVSVVFLGSSRTGYGIRPSVAEEVVRSETGQPCIAHNLHVPANGPIGQMVHWLRLLERGTRPDVVVLEILPARFTKSDKIEEEMSAFRGDRMTWREVQVVRGYGFPVKAKTDWIEANLNPWFGFRFQILGGLQEKWLPHNVTHHERRAQGDLGWKKPFFDRWLPDRYPAAIEANKKVLFDKMQEICFDEASAACFQDLIRSARESGTVPVAFVTPEASDLRAWYPPEAEQRIAAFLEELRADGLIVADGREWLPDEAFSDGHHAVRLWADEYTRRVTHEVVVPAVSRPRPNPR